MSWLGNKVRRLIDSFNSAEHEYEEVITPNKVEEASVKPDISEPIITFAKEVRSNPSRFELYTGKREGVFWFSNKKNNPSWLLVDRVQKKSFCFTLDTASGVCYGLLFLTLFWSGNVKVKTEDLSWLTQRENQYLLDLFIEVNERSDVIEQAKTKRKQANQRRRMRKLYETN